jgi:hypothetical protein
MAHYQGTPGASVEDALVFEINDVGRQGIDYYGKWIGVTRPSLEWVVREAAGSIECSQGDAM